LIGVLLIWKVTPTGVGLRLATDLRPEVLFMSLHSVVAAVHFRDDGCDQHPLPLREAGRRVHELAVQVASAGSRVWPEALNAGDVRHLAGSRAWRYTSINAPDACSSGTVGTQAICSLLDTRVGRRFVYRSR